MRGMITVADAARNSGGGKLSAIGAFWSSVVEDAIDADLVVVFRVSQDEAGEHSMRVALIRSDVESADPIAEFKGTFQVQPAASEIPPEVPAVVPLAVRLPRMELASGPYAWLLEADGELLDQWMFVVKSTRPKAKKTRRVSSSGHVATPR